MNIVKSDRGFECLRHPSYVGGRAGARLAAQSSAIGDYKDSLDRPGSSFLWVGEHHHLNREEAREFAEAVLRWVETGSLAKSTRPECTCGASTDPGSCGHHPDCPLKPIEG